MISPPNILMFSHYVLKIWYVQQFFVYNIYKRYLLSLICPSMTDLIWPTNLYLQLYTRDIEKISSVSLFVCPSQIWYVQQIYVYNICKWYKDNFILLVCLSIIDFICPSNLYLYLKDAIPTFSFRNKGFFIFRSVLSGKVGCKNRGGGQHPGWFENKVH